MMQSICSHGQWTISQLSRIASDGRRSTTYYVYRMLYNRNGDVVSVEYLGRQSGLVDSLKHGHDDCFETRAQAGAFIRNHQRFLKVKEELMSREQMNWAFYIPGQIGIMSYTESTPGMGKSEILQALAAATNRWYLEILLTQWLPEDLGGIPFQMTKTIGEVAQMYGVDPAVLGESASQPYEVMVKKPDARIILAKRVPTLCNLEEFGGIPQSMQAAALSFIKDGLGANCWMYAAGNPIEAAASGVDFAPPTVNRIVVTEWEFDAQAHDAGLKNRNQYPVPDFPVVPEDWRNFQDYWGRTIPLFLHDYPELRGKEAFPESVEQACKPYPSPRQWSNVVDCLAAGSSVGANKVTMDKMVKGCVGEAAGRQFHEWNANLGLPDANDIVEGNDYEMPNRIDLLVATVAAVTGALKSKNSPERWEHARDFVERMYDERSHEVAMSCRGEIWMVKPEGYEPPVRSGAWRDMDVMTREMANV